MKLSAWADKNGLSYRTAWRLWKTGRLPLPAEQLPTGTILVHERPVQTSNVALYGRVSSADQVEDLERQMHRLRGYAASHGLRVIEEVKEIGSGLNGHRKKLMKLLSNPSMSAIIVEHRDRLARFGSECIGSALASSQRELVIINDAECNNDIVQDMIEVLTSMCARLYGKRAAKNRVEKAKEALLSN